MPCVFPPSEESRVNAARKMRCFLDSTWGPLLRDHILDQRGAQVAAMIGQPDTSSNFVMNYVQQTCTLYDTAPVARGDATLVELLAPYWLQAAAHSYRVRALRDSLILVGWDAVANRATYELVTQDQCFIVPDSASGSPHSIGELWIERRRRVGGKVIDCWDVWDRNGLRVYSADRKRDISAMVGDLGKIPRYGRIPAVLYHGQGTTGALWNGQIEEIVMAALQIGLIWTGTVHGHLSASYDVKVLLNGRIQGGTVETAGGATVRQLVADPSAVTQVAGDNAAIDSWGASVDPVNSEKFSRMYEYRLWCLWGLPSSDFAQEVINPASGAAITVSKEGKRQIALRDAPHFRAGDLELAEVVAAVATAHGRSCSAQGLRLRYLGLRLTAQELAQLVPSIAQALEVGLLDQAGALALLHPEWDPEDVAEEASRLEERRSIEAERQAVVTQLQQRAGAPPDRQPTPPRG